MKFFWMILLLAATTQAFARLSVTTYNIRNFDRDPDAGPTNIAELKNIISDMKSDVMAFEEVVNVPAFERVVSSALPGYSKVISSCGGRGNQHLALVYNSSMFDLVKQEEDMSYTGQEGSCGSLRPVLLVTLKEKKTATNYIFAVIHLKAGGDERALRVRWSQYKKLALLAGQHERSNLILLGDFNTTGYNVRNEDYQRFDDLLGSADLRTSAETTSCTNYWHGADQSPTFIPSVLDHIVVKDSIYRQIEKVRVGGHCRVTECQESSEKDLGESFKAVSDHCPVQVVLK